MLLPGQQQCKYSAIDYFRFYIFDPRAFNFIFLTLLNYTRLSLNLTSSTPSPTNHSLILKYCKPRHNRRSFTTLFLAVTILQTVLVSLY